MNLEPSKQTKTVLCAMSGGVDSSVAAFLLKQKGYQVIGVSLQVWDYNKSCSALTKTCCSPKDFQDARLVAKKLEIPFYVLDLEKEFETAVIQKFVSSYMEGLTPSPCIDCNQFVKFGALWERKQSLGIDKLATGHHVRIIEWNGRLFLRRAKDIAKDQSYFLYNLTHDQLAGIEFPIGDFLKDEVRKIAEEQGFVNYRKKDSQDLCFLSGNLGDFLASRTSADLSGVLVNIESNKSVKVDNIFHYTKGQRRGLPFAGSKEPLYVVKIDSQNRKVYVGKKSAALARSFKAKDWIWNYRNLTEEIEGFVQIRSTHRGSKARVTPITETCVKVDFLEESLIVVPGQAAVLYDENNEVVLGGGIITNDSGQ